MKLKHCIIILVGQADRESLIKIMFSRFDQLLKNQLVYQHLKAIFEFFKQFTSGCLDYLTKSVDNFEIAHKTNMLNFGLRCSSP